MKNAIRQRLMPSLCLSLAISFLLTLYAPLELYFTNLHEFRFDIYLLLPPLLGLFAAAFCLLLAGFLASCLIYDRFCDVLLAGAGVGYLCTYIQGMFLAGNLPPLDGSPVRWADYRMQDAASLLLWFLVGLAVVLLIRFLHMGRVRKILAWGSLFLTAVLAVTTVSLIFLHDGLQRKPQLVITSQEEFTMSTDRNLVILILDALDARTFNAMLEDTDPEFKEVLEDFTFYPNTVCAYPFTHQAIPFILHGRWYENQEDFRTFTARAMDESPLLTSLEAQGYRMGMYEDELNYDSPNIHRFENIRDVGLQIASHRQFLKLQMKLVWYKYAPFPLKRMGRMLLEDFARTLTLPGGLDVFQDNNQAFYSDLTAGSVTTTPEKCFRFIHIEGAHVPFRYDENVNLIDEAQGSYQQNIRCAMTITADYLRMLKEAGVYDNSAILIMADHGYGQDREIPIIGRGNPLLAVKGVDEHHDLAVSQAPISYEDLQTAYQRLLEGRDSQSVFDAKEGDQRRRRILLYAYEQDFHMEEYVQTGHAFDITTLIPTGVIYESEQGPGPRPSRRPRGQ